MERRRKFPQMMTQQAERALPVKADEWARRPKAPLHINTFKDEAYRALQIHTAACII